MQKSSIGDLSAGTGDDFPVATTTMPATTGHYKIAYGGSIILLVLIAVVTPFANVPLRRVDAFIPVIQTAFCIANLLTATFLFAHYWLQPQRALLALASGFLSGGLLAFLQTLAFPDAYGPGVLIGDYLNSAGWLYTFWHTAFPVAVIVYTLSKNAGDAVQRSRRTTGVIIGSTVACVLMATTGLSWVALAGAEYLPSLYETTTQQAPFARVVAVYLALLTTVAAALLFVRRYTILDQWLILTLLGWLPVFLVTITLSVARFSLGWYMVRVYALLAGSSLLFVLLTETLFLYTRLANTVVLLRRSERHQRLLMAELNHRVKNILAQVEGVATSTRQGSRSIDDFVQSLGGRIQSMAAAHTLLSESGWQGVGLDTLVRAELAPYMMGANVKISGIDVILTSAETQALGRVLHELATNAVKYGALSVPTGRVLVNWERRSNGHAAANLVFGWREFGGPPLADKVRSGYGTRLIRELVPHELGGTVDLELAAEGVSCGIEFSLAAVNRDRK
jgi:two-component sensor histidine kinase